MALPVDYQTGNVTGRWVDLLGNPAEGQVVFSVRANRMVSAGTETIVVPTPITATLDLNGEIDIDLPATDDEDISPTGFTYLVTEKFSGGGGLTYSISVPAGGEIDLSAVVDIAASTGATVTRGLTGPPPTIEGTVADEGSLPSSGVTAGDVYITDDDGHGHQWDGSEWVDFGLLRGPAGEVSDQVGTWKANPDSFRRWNAAVANRATTPAVYVMVGDSVTAGAYGNLVDRLREMISPLNGGKVSPGWVNADTAGYALRPYRMKLTTGSAGSTAGDDNFNVQAGLANHSYKLASGSVLSLADGTNTVTSVWADRIIFNYTAVKTGGGSLEIRVGGSLVQTIDTNDGSLGDGETDSGRSWTWTGTRAKVAVTVTGTVASSIFDGCYIADGDKVLVYNAGHSGQSHDDYMNDGHHQFLANLDPDLVTDAHGINDTVSVPSDFTDLMEAYYDAVMANADPAPSFAFILPYQVDGHPTWGAAVVPEARAKAVALGVELIDMYAVMGVLGTGVGNNLYGLGAGDASHLSNKGSRLYARVVAEAVVSSAVDAVPRTGGRMTGDLVVQPGAATTEIRTAYSHNGLEDVALLGVYNSATGAAIATLSSFLGAGVFTLGTAALSGTATGMSVNKPLTATVIPRWGGGLVNATPTIDVGLYDFFSITNLADNITSMSTNLIGTPVQAQRLTIRFKDNGTGRSITWGAKYASMTATLPTTTVANKVTEVELRYDSVATVWRCIGVHQEP